MRFAVSLLVFWHAVVCSKVTYHKAANTLREELVKLRDEQLLLTDMQEVINSEVFEKKIVNASERIEQVKDNLGDFFKGIFQAVINIEEKTKEIYKDPNSFTNNEYSECCNITGTLAYSPHFNTKISNAPCYTRAGVSAPDVSLATSEVLTKCMQINRDQYPSITWQYFGTESGTTIFYPGYLAGDCNDYDPRFRPWYVEVATPTPKDIVIVIDRSSSMMDNNKLTLSKAAATTVINTLNPNDRVALVQFSSSAYTPENIKTENCYRDQLAFATPEVKAHLEAFVEEIVAGGDTNYTQALTLAFKILKTVPNSDRRKAILFLTDGGHNPSQAEKLLKIILPDLNAEQNNQVLILTYGIGTALGSETLLRHMANMTWYHQAAGDRQVGQFEHIQDTSELRTKFGSYYNHFTGVTTLSSPVVTVPYVDFFLLDYIFSVCLSVKHDNTLRGVACVDVLYNDIRQKVQFLEDDKHYIFIIYQTGRTLLHPLLPSPGKRADSEPLFVNISVLEPEAQKEGIIDQMRDLSDGEKTITKTLAVSRGNAMFDGMDDTQVEAHYLWRKIPETKFSVCLVTIPDLTEIKLESREHVIDFHHHKLSLNDLEPRKCLHGDRIVTTDYPTFLLADKAYTRPPSYDVDTQVQTITAYMEGINNVDMYLKPDIRGMVSVIDKVASEWKSSFKPYILQKYMGTSNGVYTCFPGRELPDEFDHTVNAWYRKAKTNIGKIVLYRQEGKIRLSQAITTKGKPSNAVLGVMGMDFKPGFFQNLLKVLIENCSYPEQFSCFLMDINGYLLFHPDAENSPGYQIPIFLHEPDIAYDLIRRDILQPSTCTDYAWKKEYHTWKVSVDATPLNSLDHYPNYFFTPIDKTTVYFIMKDKSGFSFRHCNSCPKSSPFVSPVKCSGQDCHCPCFEDADYDYCTSSFPEQKEVEKNPPCVKMEDTKEELDQGPPSDYSQCFQRICELMAGEKECNLYAECEWCYAEHDDHNRTCQLRNECSSQTFTTYSNPVTPFGNSNAKAIIISVVMVIVVITIMVGLALLWRGGIVNCNICTIPEVKPDGLPDYHKRPNGMAENGTQNSQPSGRINSGATFADVSPNDGYSGRNSSMVPQHSTTAESNVMTQYLTNREVEAINLPIAGNTTDNSSTHELNYATLGNINEGFDCNCQDQVLYIPPSPIALNQAENTNPVEINNGSDTAEMRQHEIQLNNNMVNTTEHQQKQASSGYLTTSRVPVTFLLKCS